MLATLRASVSLIALIGFFVFAVALSAAGFFVGSARRSSPGLEVGVEDAPALWALVVRRRAQAFRYSEKH